MPIKVPDFLPAKEILKKESIFVMDETRAFHQDIRPLKIVILNLMPMKQATEVQLLRHIGNTPLQVEVKLIHIESHVSKNTSAEYLYTFYNVFSDIEKEKFDGLIITGAPIELLEFENVSYWKELTQIMEWSKTNVTSTFHICWGAQAGLYYHYNIPKFILPQKIFGVFEHTTNVKKVNLMRGFDDSFYVPHSRHTEIKKQDVLKVCGLEILSCSQEAGVYIVGSKDGHQFFVTGHSEYDRNTLKDEYERDLKSGDSINPPLHYFENDDPNKGVIANWRAHASLLFSNWLNYYVYQETPYDLSR